LERLSGSVIRALERGGAVVTADAHQAFQLRLAWAEHQRNLGIDSWPSGDILSLQSLILRSARRDLIDGTGEPAILLSAAQERTLWEQVAHSERHDFLQPHGTARAAQRAWRRLHDWNLPRSRLHESGSEESRVFASWASAFEQRCSASGYTDSARSLGKLAVPADRHLPWIFSGFDTQPPALRSLIDRWTSAGIDATFDEGVHVSDARVVRAAFDDSQSEWFAAAQWARERLLRNPSQRLMVVIPDLDRERHRIERIFDEVMRPSVLLNETDAAQVPYAIEGGTALAGYPLVNTALTLVALISGPQTFDRASGFWRSRYLQEAERHSADRARLDLRVRDKGSYELDCQSLARELARAAKRLAIDDPLIAKLAVQHAEWRGRRGLASWSTHLNAALRELGWPGKLDSEEQQTLEKFNDLLAELAMLDDLVGPVDIRGLQHHLRLLAEQTRFQPQTGDAPLTISARLADPVIVLDGLWITGLHANAWPRAPRPDPFLPWELQESAGMPEATAAGMLSFAQQLTACWARRAHEVVLSWPSRLEDDETLPSSLIGVYARDAELEQRLSSRTGYWEVQRQSAETRQVTTSKDEVQADLFAPPATTSHIEKIVDVRAPALPAGVPLVGGSYALTLQSLCAIRAFADRRLVAQPLRRPEPGVDPRTRGTLAHAVLAAFWGQVANQQQLIEMGSQARTASMLEAVDAVMADNFPSPLPRFARLERQRLLDLMQEWMEIELQRQPFETLHRELPVAVQLRGHALNLQVDRIDRHADGRQQVLDYKTGEMKPGAWAGDRPDDVQLPLYATVLQPAPDGIAIAQVRARNCSLEGISSAPSLTQNKPAPDWQAQLQAWGEVIDRLMGDFESGDARVNPKKGLETCKKCHLKPFCRIDELLARDPDDEELELVDD